MKGECTSRSCSAILAALALTGAVPAGAADLPALVAGNTEFALALYRSLAAERGNLFFSPHSLSSALAMTYAGARGATAEEMAATLRFHLPPERLHAAFAALSGELERAQGEGLRLHVANALWPQEGAPFQEEYLDIVKRFYGATLEALDYRRATEVARQRINAWVEERTARKIRDLLVEGVLSVDTRMVLVNAIYFKGSWAHPFDAAQTHEAPFHLDATRTAPVPLMRRTLHSRHAELPLLSLAVLPYAGGAVSMVVVVPRAVDGLAAVERELSSATLTHWLGAAREREVEVLLPKFTLTHSVSLGRTLGHLGMRRAFSDQADFSGMDGRRQGLVLDEVVHKAFVDVHEEGTEAAAATAVVMGVLSVAEPPPVLRADRPFLFLIREERTGALLFVGRLADPTAGGGP